MAKSWWETVEWHHGVALEWHSGVPADRHPVVYAECQGPDDPCCGQCRFSVHGCNGGPSRADFLADLKNGKASVRYK